MSDVDVFRLENFKETASIYIFADLGGFTKWSQRHQSEVKKLTKLLYTTAVQIFGARKDSTFNRRLVKYLGDGSFAVN